MQRKQPVDANENQRDNIFKQKISRPNQALNANVNTTQSQE